MSVVKKGKWSGNTCIDFDDLDKPKKWTKSKMIFVCSMGDLFHESVHPGWLVMIFNTIRDCPQHKFLILTKRPGNALMMSQSARLRQYFGMPNVWLGVTAENQEMANQRVPILLQIPAVKRFVSIEPMLGMVVFPSNQIRQLHWVICGGMSGTDDYPVNPAWVDFLEMQCYVSQTPFLFKQWGGRNKKRNGRTLNGKIFDQYPEPYEFHVIYTDRIGVTKEELKEADSIVQVEAWLKEIKATYWEIGLPKNFR